MTYPFHMDAPSVADAGSEIDIQARFRARLRTIAPTVRCAAVPNAGKRSGWAAQQAKKEGMASGYPDVIVTWCNGQGVSAVPGVAWLEFKTKTGTVEENQFDWLMHLHNCGHNVGVFRSVETAIAFLRKAGAPFLFQQEEQEDGKPKRVRKKRPEPQPIGLHSLRPPTGRWMNGLDPRLPSPKEIFGE